MNKCIKLILINLLIVCLLSINMYAEKTGISGIILPVLNYDAGTRALGVGTAYTALSDEITSMYWNPAGLGRLTRQQVYGLYEKLYQDTIYGFLGYSIPFYRIGVFGVGLIFLTTSHIPRYDAGDPDTRNNPVYEGEYSNTESMLVISYGSPLDNIKKFESRHFRFFDVGMSMKIIKHTMYDYEGYAVAFDIGTKYIPLKTMKILRDFIFGLVVQNIIPPGLKLINIREWYPLKFKFGTVYRTLYDTLFISMDINQIVSEGRTPEINIGIEYWTMRMFRFRTGYNKRICFGVGMEIEDFTFDYALNYNFDWGLLHQFSASFRFGKPRYR